jgi:iron-sulfur cluster protein
VSLDKLDHRTFVGMPPFPEAARTALADSQLRHNLEHATHTIRDKRARVVAEVADWEDLRTRAAAIKDETLAHLDEHLLTLEAALQANGAVVHWARDAAEACAIVADIAKAHDVDEVLKVKSMATQEIELNEALSQQGIQAWETDLAELIVQLGDDLPSHILVPAIHRNRAEIRQIFEDHMAAAGRPAPDDLTDDPGELASAARLHLREKFLRAKVAVSGANFAVAKTGTLVVVESEGNGRMCLTLPEVLVSVVGIEKVVPTFEELDVFLQVLPRSSTGERMNPYTSMWSGVTPGDGPQEVHVVLLDNGRTRALAQEVGRQALRCIRCSACLNVCPVYERVGGHAYGSTYPGPIGAILNPLLKGVGTDPQVDALPYASSLCGACYEVCPVKIDIPTVLIDLRGRVTAQERAEGGSHHRGERAAMRMVAAALGSRRRYELAQKAARAGSFPLSKDGRIERQLPGPLSGWTAVRDLETPPKQSFRQWWAQREKGTRR